MVLFRTRHNRGARNGRSEHPVDEVLPPGRMFAYGIQHIAAMYAGVVAPPLIIGAALGLSPMRMSLLIAASLLTAGIATLLQSLGIWRIGSRLPFVNGVSFGTVTPVLAIVAQHPDASALPIIYGSVIIAGALAFLVAPFFAQLIRFFPPVVTGSVITVIGLSLFPTAAQWIVGEDTSAPDYGSLPRLALGATTLLVVLLLSRFLRGFWNRIALLLAMMVGTLVAWPMGMVDTSTFQQSPTFNLPVPFQLAAPTFDLAATVSLCIVMLVAMVESTADMMALGEIVERPAGRSTIAAGLRADAASSTISAVFGGFTCSAFAQNIGLVALTRVRSRYVVAAAGVVLVLLGVFPVAGGVVSLVPKPVLGGVGLVLFGSIAASGIRTLTRADLSDPFNGLIVASSIGVGIIPVAAPHFYDQLPDGLQTVLGSGISSGTITAVALNLLFNVSRGINGRDQQEPVEQAAAVEEPAAGALADTPRTQPAE